ncbi:msl-3 [Drosophila busckii]|uniref:Protein male-specific lethal-3 n=1 Tax=Drosophila busckii TaxID=30019 RepID=A0A0M4EA64_DROBS|nr:protein male-specific lethal-3 [Drosophila busckii]ALC44104.1 msl-3 [Drosophila busckii]
MTASENEVQLFNRGEKVLCYEPDQSKHRVLYDSKVLAVYTRKDKQGQIYYGYKIHFQGWSASWDKEVRAPILLKDNEENRKLQRELAAAAQLEKTGGFSYKDTKTPTLPSAKRKRVPKSEEQANDSSPLSQSSLFQKNQKSPANLQDSSANRTRDKSRGRKSLLDESVSGGDATMRNSRKSVRGQGKRKAGKTRLSFNNASEATAKLFHQEDRVMLRISERLREYMEYDYHAISKVGMQHVLPARVPIVTILENFVKQTAVELAIGIKQESLRARNTQSRNAKLEREFDRVMSNVCMLKEVVDGLRIYFEFHLEDHLLYKEEMNYIQEYLTPENLKARRDYLNNVYDAETYDMEVKLTTTPEGENILGGVEYEKQLEKCLVYIVKKIGKGKTNLSHAYDQRDSPYKAAYRLPNEMRGFLCETFSWRLLSAESPPEKSMVFGAPHLARLLVKIPEWLNGSPIPNEKLKDLLPHLGSLINYVENHKAWFDKDNYTKISTEYIVKSDPKSWFDKDNYVGTDTIPKQPIILEGAIDK